jgi:MMPL family/ABC-2 type transporter
MISRDFPRHAVEDVLFDSLTLRVSDPAYQAAIRDVLSRIQATGRVTQVQSPLDPRFANQVSATRHAALLQFRLTGSVGDSATRVVPVLAAVRAAAADHPQVQIAETGDASISKAIDDTVLRDLRRAELLSFPITLVVLLIAFGALVAALLPLGLGLVAILAASGLVAFTSRLSGVTVQATSVMLLIGLAVGVDYSMFYVKRQREERAAGRPVLDAIETAAATSGRSVLISGLTVLLAMSGMFLTGSKIFYGIGQATMLVVAVAVIGSLTLLPALLALLGDRVDRGRLPFADRLRQPAGQSRFWTAVLDRVLARLLAAPISRASILGGKLLTSFLLGTISMTVLAVATTLLFGASWGNPLGVAVLVVAAILAATGIMALIATLAKNAEQAANWQSVVAVILGLVGGTFFPVSQAPGVLSRLTFVAPQAWFLRGLGDLRGGSISAVWIPALAMLIFAVVTGGLAMTRLNRLAEV